MFAFCLICSPVWAADALVEGGKDKKLTASAELGFVATTGNTHNQSLNGKFNANYDPAKWRHNLDLEALKTSDQTQTTAERYILRYKADYKFSERSYIYGAFRGESDRFTAYDYRLSESVGYGRRVWQVENGSLDLEAGPGASQNKLKTGETEEEGIFRLGAKYAHQITTTTKLTEDLTVQSGQDNTETESITGVQVKINSKLATKLTLTVLHNTDVPPEQRHTDTTTAITLVYAF
jgi:putative salt-induced outer membrane protein